jgi:hypothetical protein
LEPLCKDLNQILSQFNHLSQLIQATQTSSQLQKPDSKKLGLVRQLNKKNKENLFIMVDFMKIVIIYKTKLEKYMKKVKIKR